MRSSITKAAHVAVERLTRAFPTLAGAAGLVLVTHGVGSIYGPAGDITAGGLILGATYLHLRGSAGDS